MENVKEYFDLLADYALGIKEYDAYAWKDHLKEKNIYLMNIQNKLIHLPNEPAVERYAIFMGEALGSGYHLFKEKIIGEIRIDRNGMSEAEYEYEFYEKHRELINKAAPPASDQIDRAYRFIDDVVRVFGSVGLDIVDIIIYAGGLHSEYFSPFSLWGGVDEEAIRPPLSPMYHTDDIEYEEEEGDNASTNNELPERNTRQRLGFKSRMTQAQLSTMFRLLRDKGIFDLNNTQLASLITSLSSGSHQRVRALLGGENAGHINMTLKTRDQATEIQDILQEIIAKIEEDKKDIIS